MLSPYNVIKEPVNTRELRISMGSGECVAGDHPRHGTEYLVFFSVFILL